MAEAFITRRGGSGGEAELAIVRNSATGTSINFNNVDLSKTLMITVTFLDNSYYVYSGSYIFKDGVVVSKTQDTGIKPIVYEEDNRIYFSMNRGGSFISAWMFTLS